MSIRTTTMVRRPPALRGVPPRYQVFDRRKAPPMTVGVFYRSPEQDAVVFEVFEDEFRELLKQDPKLREKRFAWMLDVAPDAPGDTISAIVRPGPMPVPELHGSQDAPPLTLEDALDALRGEPRYRVTRTSDPL